MAKSNKKVVKAEKPVKPAVPTEKAQKKSAAVKPKVVKKDKKASKPVPVPSDDSDETDSDDEPAPKSVPKKAGASSDESSESSSEDEKPKSVQLKSKPTKDKSDSSDSDSDSEVEKPKGAVTAPKPTISKTTTSDSSSDSDSDDDAPQKSKTPLTKPSADASSDSDSSSSDSDVEMGDGTAPVNGKRKAQSISDAAPKKQKLENGAAKPISDLNPTQTKSLFVGNLSWNIDSDRLASEFGVCGEVESARVQMDRNTGKSRGFGYVSFVDADGVGKAMETMQGFEFDGRGVRLDPSESNSDSKEAGRTKRAAAFGDNEASGPPTSTLFVGNLSWNTTEDTVWETFGDFGVKAVRIPTDRDSGQPKGYGYVEFENADGAKGAYDQLKGTELDGRPLRLDYSQPRDSAGGQRGGRGGGRGFGDRGGRGGGFGDRGGRGGGFGGRGRGGDRGGRGGGWGGRGGDRGGDRGGRGRGGRGAPRGGARTGGIVASEGRKMTFD